MRKCRNVIFLYCHGIGGFWGCQNFSRKLFIFELLLRWPILFCTPWPFGLDEKWRPGLMHLALGDWKAEAPWEEGCGYLPVWTNTLGQDPGFEQAAESTAASEQSLGFCESCWALSSLSLRFSCYFCSFSVAEDIASHVLGLVVQLGATWLVTETSCLAY